MPEETPHEEVQPVRIVKKDGHGKHHGGAWKVAYADFTTSMLALFIVLWILAQSEEVRQGVSGYFRDPAAIGKAGAGLLKGKGPALMPTQTHSKSKAIPSEDPLQELERQASSLKTAIETTPELTELSEQIQIEVTGEGVRVEMLDAEDRFFKRGSAELTQSLRRALELLGRKFSEWPSQIVIEGHTDNVPYAQDSPLSNWELSTERANRARRVLVSAGLPEERIFAVRGYADRRLRVPQNPMDARNRRISILLLSHEGLAIAKGLTSLEESVSKGSP
ncbi:MAG: chemotaxis protein MotB [Calditrichaeota bacterium]|nr:chemotaxis protein MotB [Calditrichota bacterium]